MRNDGTSSAQPSRAHTTWLTYMSGSEEEGPETKAASADVGMPKRESSDSQPSAGYRSDGTLSAENRLSSSKRSARRDLTISKPKH